jgi:hypothetical protein
LQDPFLLALGAGDPDDKIGVQRRTGQEGERGIAKQFKIEFQWSSEKFPVPATSATTKGKATGGTDCFHSAAGLHAVREFHYFFERRKKFFRPGVKTGIAVRVMVVPEIDRESTIRMVEIEGARSAEHAETFSQEFPPKLGLVWQGRNRVAGFSLFDYSDVFQQAATEDNLKGVVSERQTAGICPAQ